MPSKHCQLLQDFEISAQTGFLFENPCIELPGKFEPWKHLCQNAAGLISAGKFRQAVDQSPVISHNDLTDIGQLYLAHLQLTTIASGYVWQNGELEIPEKLPPQIAIPLWSLSNRIEMRPIVCHAACVLHNFQRQRQENELSMIDDSATPSSMYESDLPDDSLRMLHMKLIEEDDIDHFFRITAKMELEFAKVPAKMLEALIALERGEREVLQDTLKLLKIVFHKLLTYIPEMYSKVDPQIFFSKVRPFLAGYSGKAFQRFGGIIFDGVSDKPQSLVGGSAAQSAILQSTDLFLGLHHPESTAQFLTDMRTYMPKPHQRFLRFLEERGAEVVNFVKEEPSLTEDYNACIDAVRDFRSKHIQMVCSYVSIPGKNSIRRSSLDHEGTGGTGFMSFLKKVRDSTDSAKILI